MSGEPAFLARVTMMVEKNLDNEGFGVSELARDLGLSRSTLYRRMNEEAGISVSKFIRNLKLEKAMNLLKESSFNVSEIAYACGFHSVTYFDQCFKEHYRKTPLQVKSDLQSEKLETQRRNVLHHFPSHIASFIGRKHEISEIITLLDSHRIVSLVGVGGCGKTRLACEVAGQLTQYFKEGIWFVDLIPVTSEEMVFKAVMETLHISELPGQQLIDSLEAKLKDETRLIILDNCEHLITSCRLLVERLTQSAPGIKILATSREILHVSEERVWHIPTLNLADPDTVAGIKNAMESEAVCLFTDRARMGDRRFELNEKNFRDVVTICSRIEGIPLAIELVAGRIRFMDPFIILERLSQSFSQIQSADPGVSDRNKTMNAAISWSYQFLEAEEQHLFKNLCVFSGGFDLYAAESVCKGPALAAEQILEVLTRLVDKSMLYTIREKDQSMRYNMLETIREYGIRLWTKEEEKELRLKHFDYYTLLAEQAYRERLKSQNHWTTILRQENNNLLAALYWSEQQLPKKYAELAGYLAWFWNRSNYQSLAIKLLEKALSEDNLEKEIKAMILSGYGLFLGVTPGQIHSGIEMLQRSRSLWQEVKNSEEEALVLADLALSLYNTGDNDAGLEHASEAYSIARQHEEPSTLLYCMLPLSQGLVNLKRFNEARTIAGEIISNAESLGNYFGMFAGHHHLADCALMEGKYLESEQEYGTGIEIVMQYQDMVPVLVELTGIAMSVSGQGRYAKGLRLNSAATVAAMKTGALIPEKMGLLFWQEQVQLHIVGARKKLGEKLTKKYESEGLEMKLQEAIDYALDYERD